MPLYAFDGTWNELRTDDLTTPVVETDHNTNVVRFANAYASKSFHFNGIGTKSGRVGRAVGGAFGVGGRQRVADALAHVRARRGEPIDAVGFSRGAALALTFANRVAEEIRDGRGAPVRVRWLGLFDVVGAFGVPVNLGPLRFQEYNVGYKLTLPANVDYCFHALALDERRQTFQPTRVAGACEVWFRGAHSDIGGGNGNLGLNAIALCWMLRKALACGLPITEDAIQVATVAADPLAPVRWPDPDPIANAFRAVRPSDRVHHTVMRPCLNRRQREVPVECPTEDAASERCAERVRTAVAN